jgi:phospholipid/cholesterol/gamma-HCH transport system substrate-binding protein
MLADVQEVTSQLRGVVTDLRSLIGAAESEAAVASTQPGAAEQAAAARQQIGGIRETVDKLNKSLESLAQVTERIAAGEGTVGRLLTDDKIANDLEDAIEGAGNIVSGINRLDTHVKVLAWYNFNTNTAHDGLSVQLQPRPDKYYLVELMDDPRRAPVYRWTTTETNDPLHGGSATTTTTINEFVASATDDFRLTAMFAKMWGPLTLRVGVIENSGGVGANLDFWENRIRLRSDLFQFSWIDRWPRWRTYAEFEPIEHLFVIGGVDDVINAFDRSWRYNPTGWDYFAGAGISFTDDDLKSLLTVVPMP